MKGKYFYNNAIIIFIIMLLFQHNMFIKAVKAMPNDEFSKIEQDGYTYNPDINYKNIKYFYLGSDTVLKGLFSSHSWYFDIDKWWNVDSIGLEVLFNISELIDNTKEANLSFSINGKPFSSHKVYYDPKVETQSIKLQIPKRLVKEGTNELKVEGYCRISDKPCSDDVNIGNWIILQDKSQISIGFKNKESSNNISQFPYPFFKTNESRETDAFIIIPDNYNNGDLTAAFMLSSYFGSLNKYGDYKTAIGKYSEVLKKENRDIVYIGSYSSAPDAVKSIYSGAQWDFKNEAVIKEAISPFSKDKKIIAICSDSEELIVKAIRGLMNKEFTTQLDTDVFKIDKNIKLENTVKELNPNLTFKDLGYTELSFRGPFRRSSTISYLLPKNRVLSQGSKITLLTRYSQNLDFNRALLTVYINGTPIGSKKLEKDLANGDKLELQIPSDVKSTNYVEMKIAFDLELANSFCELRQEEMPWAVVTGDSFLYIPSNKVSSYNFETYPNPFIADNSFNNLVVVIPDKLSSQELSSLGGVFSNMGKDIKNNGGEIKVIKSSSFNKDFYNMHLLIYGTPESNLLIKEINKNLWFKYSENYKSLLSNEKLYLVEPFASNIAVFQFDKSPFNKQNAILVMTSPDSEILRKSLLYLSSSKASLKLLGDSAVIDKYGNLRTFKFKKDVNKPIYEEVKNISKNTRDFLIFAGLLLVFAITAAVLYYNKNKKFK